VFQSLLDPDLCLVVKGTAAAALIWELWDFDSNMLLKVYSNTWSVSVLAGFCCKLHTKDWIVMVTSTLPNVQVGRGCPSPNQTAIRTYLSLFFS
jgi:hypothetical protein